MHERAITAMLLVVAVIHLLPFSGFFSAERLIILYRVEALDSNLEILMRHRAVLFGVLGAFLAYAAFKPLLQPVAMLAGSVSVASFLYLCFTVGHFNEAIRNVVVADLVASVSLALAIALHLTRPSV